MEITEIHYRMLQEEARRLGGDLFGVADLTQTPIVTYDLDEDLLGKLPFGISIGVRLADAILEDIEDHPTLLYLHHYRQANYILDRIAFHLAAIIQRAGGNAIPIAASQIVDWEQQRGHLSHKELAQAAGLGWRGRNNLLVNPAYGARIRLVSILTDLPLQADKPLDNSCDTCRRCIAVCPAGAIKDDIEEFDHRGCFEKLKEFRNKYNVGQYICGVCIKACQSRNKKKPLVSNHRIMKGSRT
jgi:epoxyqueuosine reductase